MQTKKTLIIDDKKENIDAYKKAIKQYFPELNATYAYSEKEGLYLLDERHKYDLVITDRVMEDEFSGYKIIDKSIDYRIPAFMITEYQHGGKISSVSPVVLASNDFGEYNYYGAKNDPETLNKLIQKIFNNNSEGIYNVILFGTINKAIERYDKFVGQKQSKEMSELIDLYKEPLFELIHQGGSYLDYKKN